MPDTSPCVSLADTTQHMLINRPRPITYKMIADECGVSIRWLEVFAAGKVRNPGVRSVEAVNRYLSK